MLGTSRFERRFSSGVSIPAKAVLLSGARHSVFVQTSPGVFERREIELEYEGPKEVIVAHGLQAGEQVVSDNALLLARQFRVAQDEASAAEPAPSPKAEPK
jgi:cobalt-zinc-cadmium efflux system membrane fusion protein